MSADYKQLTAFQNKIEKLNEEQKEEFLQECCKELAARLLAKVIKRTPVGKKPEVKEKTVKVTGESGKTKLMLTAEGAMLEQYWSGYVGGTLRRGWTGGKKLSAKEYANSLSVKKVGDKYIIDITNPIEYASYVEYGHRQTPGKYVPSIGKRLKKGWVDGHHMLSLSETELNNSSDAILRAKISKFMKDVFE